MADLANSSFDNLNKPIDYWKERWTAGKTGWHQEEANEYLVRHSGLLLPPGRPCHRVFVPLCGKTRDLLWLHSQGHEVVGVEAASSAIEDFFSEHKMSYTVCELAWAKLYQSSDGRLKVYNCDLFSAVPEQLGQFSAVWDRGSLVAINVSDRRRYACLMKQLVAPQFRYLLAVLHYTPNEQFSGPPCAIPDSVINCLFGDEWQWQQLELTDRSDDPKFGNYGLGKFEEAILLLQAKL